jgi:hypothetical protein
MGFQSGLAIDFANDRDWRVFREQIVCSRASTAYGETASGLWVPFASNTPVITTKGLASWEARTNAALWCRNLTNAAWPKVNVTAALDQVGIDGTANTASSIVATAGNGTCLQAITLASSARYQTAFVKRLTGSGTVEMTMDNGATWTAVTVTASWSRVSIPTQTLANPTVGFRLVTSGDAIAVDFVQNENGTFATSLILTTTGSAARAADLISLNFTPSFLANPKGLSLFAAFTPAHVRASICSLIEVKSDAANNTYIYYSSTPRWRIHDTRLSVDVDVSSGTLPAIGVEGKVVGVTLPGSVKVAANGNAVVTSATASGLPAYTTVYILSSTLSAFSANGVARMLALGLAMSDSAMREITAL